MKLSFSYAFAAIGAAFFVSVWGGLAWAAPPSSPPAGVSPAAQTSGGGGGSCYSSSLLGTYSGTPTHGGYTQMGLYDFSTGNTAIGWACVFGGPDVYVPATGSSVSFESYSVSAPQVSSGDSGNYLMIDIFPNANTSDRYQADGLYGVSMTTGASHTVSLDGVNLSFSSGSITCQLNIQYANYQAADDGHFNTVVNQ